MRILAAGLAIVLAVLPAAALAQSGRWASTDHVTVTGPKAGAKFFLDVTFAADGSFKGTWEELVCFNYSGPYGIVTVSCQRSRKPQAASGKIDASSATGRIDLHRLGKSSFKYKVGANQKGVPQMEIELPRGWLKQGDPVLYETSLNPKGS